MENKPIKVSLHEELARLRDPELGATFGDLEMLGEVVVRPGAVEITLRLTTPGCPLKVQMRRSVESVLVDLGLDPHELSLHFVSMDDRQRANAMSAARRFHQQNSRAQEQIGASTQILAFGSGKGGVGKSSLTAAVVEELARRGFRVGVLDADIWGYSLPHLMMRDDVPRLEAHGTKDAWKIAPFVSKRGRGEIRTVSMGMLATSESEAIMWRGLMLSRAFTHFIEDVEWQEPDYLVIDLPPGTGDIPLTLATLCPETRMVLVTTPSPLAVSVAQRGASMAAKANLAVLGVVENLSWIDCEEGHRVTPFGEGGGRSLAARLGVPLLGQIPFAQEMSGEKMGKETANPHIEAVTSRIIEELDRSLAGLESCSSRLWEALEH